MSKTEKDNIFSKDFYYIILWTVTVIVTLTTCIFYPLVEAINMVWLPLLFIYGVNIWGFTLLDFISKFIHLFSFF